MKGPFERLKYDLRRLWECPLCRRKERTSGTVTARFCQCAAKQEGGRPISMCLIADGPQRLVPVIVGRISESEAEAPTPAADATVVETILTDEASSLADNASEGESAIPPEAE